MSNRMVSSLSSSSSSSSSPFSFAIILFLFSSPVSSSSSFSSSSSSTLFFFLFVANIHPFVPYFKSRVGGQHNASWMQRKNCGGSEKSHQRCVHQSACQRGFKGPDCTEWIV